MQLVYDSLTLQSSEVQEMGKSTQQGRFSLTTAEVIQEKKNGGTAKVSRMPLCLEKKRVRNPIKQGLILHPFSPSLDYLLRCAQSALPHSAVPLSSVSIALIPHIKQVKTAAGINPGQIVSDSQL